MVLILRATGEKRIDRGGAKLIVTMGGSDPKGFTRLALKAVAQLTTLLQARFVIIRVSVG